MNRIPLIDRNSTTPERKQLLDAIHAAFGASPNMFRAVANAPAALRSMWGSFGALGKGVIGAQLGTKIAGFAKPEHLRLVLAAIVLVIALRMAFGLGIRPDEVYSVVNL